MERIITDTMFQDFRNYLKENERSEATIHKYIHDIDCFSVYVDGREIDKEIYWPISQNCLINMPFPAPIQ